MQLLKSSLVKIISLDEPEWAAFAALFDQRLLDRHALFAVENRKETEIGFLETGVIRAFYRNGEGAEYNKKFFVPGEFFGAYTALVTNQPSKINLEALTPCKVYVANYSAITALFEQHRKIETLARLVAQQFYIEKEKREIELALLQADERYQIFRNSYPGLEAVVPQYHIASYLGITPTQLSRIRAKKSQG